MTSRRDHPCEGSRRDVSSKDILKEVPVKARIHLWGDSLALCIPRAFAADANLVQESEVDLSIADGKLIVTPIVEPSWSLDSLLQAVTSDNLHREIDSGPAVGADAW